MNKSKKTEIIEKYKNAATRLILLDYDGTLVDYNRNPSDAKPSDKLSGILKKLVENPKTKVMIISGRGHQDLERFLGHLQISFIAEHGAMIREEGAWEEKISDNTYWKKAALPLFHRISSTCPESFVEEKPFSLAWHYRNAESRTGYDHSRELIRLLGNFINSFNLRILDGNKAVELIPDIIGKGKAAKNLLNHKYYDFLLSIGDDVTDEEIFELFVNNANAVTIKVGNGRTLAKYKAEDVGEVVELLKYLSE